MQHFHTLWRGVPTHRQMVLPRELCSSQILDIIKHVVLFRDMKGNNRQTFLCLDDAGRIYKTYLNKKDSNSHDFQISYVLFSATSNAGD